MSDRDVDFWKTLANWYSDYERIKAFSSLILFTTSQIKSDSAWNSWSCCDSSKKLKDLKGIGVDTKPNEKEFRKQYNRIFCDDYDEKNYWKF